MYTFTYIWKLNLNKLVMLVHRFIREAKCNLSFHGCGQRCFEMQDLAWKSGSLRLSVSFPDTILSCNAAWVLEAGILKYVQTFLAKDINDLINLISCTRLQHIKFTGVPTYVYTWIMQLLLSNNRETNCNEVPLHCP